MKCREFEEYVIDLARRLGAEGPEQREALAHARGCRRCSARLEVEREVTAALRMYDDCSAAPRANARGEHLLRQAFAAQGRPRIVRRKRHISVAVLATAAAAFLIILAGVRLLRPPEPAPAPVARLAAPAPSPSPTAAVMAPATAPGRLAPKRRPRPAPKRPEPQVHEVATPFYPLQYGTEPDGVAVLRMEVPRTMLASFGLPINEERASDPVQADVVLDNTGTARAIRFVR